MNIITNAIDAIEAQNPPRVITIHTELVENKELKMNGSEGKIAEPDSNVSIVVKIADNGPGIPPAIKNKIFDPFFTTKPVGQGTGLGLSICHQIIEKHKGQIAVNSQTGKGTEFVITLPVKQTRATSVSV